MDRNNVRQILSQGAEGAMTQKKPGKTSCICGNTNPDGCGDVELIYLPS